MPSPDGNANEDEQKEDDVGSEAEREQSESSDRSSGTEEPKSCLSDTKRPRRVQAKAQHVTVPAVKPRHESWEAWECYLQEYKLHTHQVLATIETMSCDLRNKKLAQSAAAKRGQIVDMVPPELKVFKRVYVCTHSVRPKHRCSGVRPRQFSRYTKCPFKMTAMLFLHDHKWEVTVRNAVFEHNHHVSSDVFKTYASSRGIAEEENKSSVLTMLAGRSKRSKIFDFLLERSENVTKQDVDNMVAKFRTQEQHVEDDDAVAEVIAKFLAADSLNMATVDESEAGHSA
ncbi:TPA: hypothetical protein N0F65_003748, partial [Lagenidium giganteum]